MVPGHTGITGAPVGVQSGVTGTAAAEAAESAVPAAVVHQARMQPQPKAQGYFVNSRAGIEEEAMDEKLSQWCDACQLC